MSCHCIPVPWNWCHSPVMYINKLYTTHIICIISPLLPVKVVVMYITTWCPHTHVRLSCYVHKQFLYYTLHFFLSPFCPPSKTYCLHAPVSWFRCVLITCYVYKQIKYGTHHSLSLTILPPDESVLPLYSCSVILVSLTCYVHKQIMYYIHHLYYLTILPPDDPVPPLWSCSAKSMCVAHVLCT